MVLNPPGTACHVSGLPRHADFSRLSVSAIITKGKRKNTVAIRFMDASLVDEMTFFF
jgi:hypothetical protein